MLSSFVYSKKTESGLSPGLRPELFSQEDIMPLRATTFRGNLGVKKHFNIGVNPFAEGYYKALTDHRLPILNNEQLKEKRLDPFEFLAEHQNVQTGRPIIVEIGCHKGTLLLQLAKSYPEYNFIGLDITFKRVMMTAERVVEAQLSNVAVALANAHQIHELFAESSVSGLIIFFPDPWPKKSHLKHRLISKSFCQSAYNVAQDGCFFWLKTDSFGYFDDARLNILMSGFNPVAEPHEIQEQGFTSTFEKHFRGDGLPVAEGFWEKANTLREQQYRQILGIQSFNHANQGLIQ
jgi:tRNA (guanine-N7-)-methyltransferase